MSETVPHLRDVVELILEKVKYEPFRDFNNSMLVSALLGVVELINQVEVMSLYGTHPLMAYINS